MEIGGMPKRVTQKDVAVRAGVSTSIVSYVINNGPRSVSRATRVRVLRAVEELGYRPNKHAQMLMRRKWESAQAPDQFGIVVGGDANRLTRPFYGEIVAGIYEEAHRCQMRVRFLQFLDELTDPLLFNELIHPDEVGGLLLLAVDPDDLTETHQTLVSRILDRIESVVCVERQWGHLPAVIFARADAAEKAVSHLISLGHRRIGYIGSLDARIEGYRRSLHTYGLAYDDALAPMQKMQNSPADGYLHARRLLALPNPPTAIFACSDEVAIGVIGGLNECGVRVPHDIALASVDDIPIAAYVSPRLTTVHVPKAEMGAYGVRMLSERAQRPDSPSVTVVLPTQLIVRESCGAALTTAPVQQLSHLAS